MLVLDSGGLSRLSERTRRAAALITVLRREGLWPPLVPTVVLAESISGRPGTDTNINRFLATCDIEVAVPEATARRAGELRARAGRGSAVEALVVALAGPAGTVLTGDTADVQGLAAHAEHVGVEVV